MNLSLSPSFCESGSRRISLGRWVWIADWAAWGFENSTKRHERPGNSWREGASLDCGENGYMPVLINDVKIWKYK